MIGILNLLYGMTTNLNKRFIFSLICKPLAPGYEADLLSCPDPFQKNRGFPKKGSGHETILNAANIDQNMYLSVVFYSTQCITTIYVEVIFTVYDFNIACS